MSAIDILESFKRFAESPTTYRGSRCGRFVEAINLCIISLKDRNIEFAKKEDYKWWVANQGRNKKSKRAKK